MKFHVLFHRQCNSARGVWVLTPKGQKQTAVSKDEVKKYVQNLDKKGRTKKKEKESKPHR